MASRISLLDVYNKLVKLHCASRNRRDKPKRGGTRLPLAASSNRVVGN
jgi:hypothetical protein